MDLQLKKIKVYERLSEETTAFSADMYVDGKKIAEVENSGKGGCNDYHVLNREVFKLLEKEAIERDKEYNFEQLDHWVDDLLVEEVRKQDTAKFQKKMQKQMETHLVIVEDGKTDAYSTVKVAKDGKTPISAFLKDDKAKARVHVLVQRIKMQLKKGERIVNTNLPKEWL